MATSSKTEVVVIQNVIKLLSETSELKTRFRVEIDALKHRQTLAAANKFRLAVMGVTSSGKSTMLNALLGKPLLPSVAVPSSSQLVACIKKPEWGATIFFKDGRQKKVSARELTPNLIREYGEEKFNPSNKKGVSQIEITSPQLPTPEDLIIEDSPGLDAYGLEGHEHITMHMLLPTTDFCLFVTTCKTNSDRKTLEVLNEIAKYGKPVIIVQNMIDSIKGTPDGKKTATEVAKEHIVRIQRIVDQSKIKNHSVHIVQISATYAMAVREYLNKGKSHNQKSKRYWAESNFDELCRVITEVFNSLKPEIEQNRLSALKKELIELNSHIVVGEASQLPVSSIDYQSVKERILNLSRNASYRINRSLNSLTDSARVFSQKVRCYDEDVKSAKTLDNRVVIEITNIMSDFNQALDKICGELNISSRDFAIRVPAQSSRSISVAYKTETYRVKKDGFWNGVKRLFGSSSGYETKSRQVIDPEENRKRIITFLKQAYDDLNQKASDWFIKVESIEKKIIGIIENKKSQFEEAVKAANDNLISRKRLVSIKNGVQNIINEISTTESIRRSNAHECRSKQHHVLNKITKKIEIPQDTFQLINISKFVINKTHQMIWRNLINKGGCDIITWDMDIARRFMHTSFGINFSSSNTTSLFNTDGIGYVKLYNPNSSSPYQISNRRIIFMVNATQTGAAKKQLAAFLANNHIINNPIFLIQDLEEVINGGDVFGSLQDLKLFFKSRGLRDYLLLPFHPNPLYCIAMLESHTRQIRNHSEEMNLMKELTTNLSYYFEENSPQIVADLIRND